VTQLTHGSMATRGVPASVGESLGVFRVDRQGDEAHRGWRRRKTPDFGTGGASASPTTPTNGYPRRRCAFARRRTAPPKNQILPLAAGASGRYSDNTPEPQHASKTGPRRHTTGRRWNACRNFVQQHIVVNRATSLGRLISKVRSRRCRVFSFTPRERESVLEAVTKIGMPVVDRIRCRARPAD